MTRRWIAVALLTSGSMTVGPSADTRLPAGTWGGTHAEVEVTTSGAHLEFDCASGDISQVMTTGDEGRLGVEGGLVRERPGPIRVGEQPARLRARRAGELTRNG